MSTPARKRLMRDFKRLQQDPPAGISGAPQDNNIMLWNAVIFGPDDTPWDGGTFKLTLQFSEDYPNKPPTVRFVSRMFHPNTWCGSILYQTSCQLVRPSGPVWRTSIFTQMEAFAWISCRTNGAQFMMSLQYLHQSSRCSVTQTQTHLQIRKLHGCSVKTSVNTIGECVRLWSRAGRLTDETLSSTMVVVRLGSSV
ncbi:uncharacterized protein [Elaeis guineensis]|uniref:uncharacterized protein isoform X1 n=1 Tax=Elaeis guineensis var. tenera TaxID=51953 RepID=UPI00057A72C2